MSDESSAADSTSSSRWEGKVLKETYRLESQIAEGGMGVVMLGLDMRMERQVAVKLIDPEVAKQSMMRERFEREIKISRSFSHPNIIQLFDYGETREGTLFMVLEYLKGRDLESVLQDEGPFGWSRAADITLQILEALAEAHRHDIIHRDIKPANVFLTDRRRAREHVKILDFGVAKPLKSTRSMTGAQKVLGTPDYLSPELLFGKSPSKRSDVYAVGLLFLEMLLGRSIYSAASTYETLLLHIYEPVPMPEFLLTETPIGTVIRRGTMKHPEERYASAQPMLDDLADAIDQTPSGIEEGSHHISLVNRTRALLESSADDPAVVPETMDVLKSIDPVPAFDTAADETIPDRPGDATTVEAPAPVTELGGTSKIHVPQKIADRAEKTADQLTWELGSDQHDVSFEWRDVLPTAAYEAPDSSEEKVEPPPKPTEAAIDPELLEDIQSIFENALTVPGEEESDSSPDTGSERLADMGETLENATVDFEQQVTVERQGGVDNREGGGSVERGGDAPQATHIRDGETEPSIEVPGRNGRSGGRTDAGGQGAADESESGSIWRWAAVALVVVGAAGAGLYLSRSKDATSAASDDEPPTVEVEFRSSPPGAELFYDGEVVGTTPATVTFEESKGSLQIAAHKPGFVPKTLTIDLTDEQESYAVELQTEGTGPGPKVVEQAIQAASKRLVGEASKAAGESARFEAGHRPAAKALHKAATSADEKADETRRRRLRRRRIRWRRQRADDRDESKTSDESGDFDNIAEDFVVD